jgi:hypothetical protein
MKEEVILPGLLGDYQRTHSPETYQPTSTMRWDNWDRGIDSGYLSWIICLKKIGQIYDQVF